MAVLRGRAGVSDARTPPPVRSRRSTEPGRRAPARGNAEPARDDARSHLRLDVQGLRAVAVLLVVAFHAGLPVPGGFIGVDVFLVISGFVITGMLLRELEKTGTISLRTFYSRRVKRLLPALGLLITVVMVLSGFFDSSLGTQQTTASTGLGATYLVANVVIYSDSIRYFSDEAATNPLLHTWTLSVEEQTYLIFPSLLLGSWVVARILRRRSRSSDERDGTQELVGVDAARTPRWGVGVMLMTIGVVSFAVSLQVSLNRTSLPPSWAFYSSLARVWEFAVGAALALSAASLRRIHPVVSLVLGGAGATAILVGAFTLSGAVPYPGTAALLPVVGTAAVIAAGFRSTSPVTRALATTPMTRIGDVSYSWYLWHWPLIVYAAVVWPGVPWVPAAAAAASLVVAAASYAWVEHPIRADARIRGWRVVGIFAASVLVPTVAALALLAGAGSSWGDERVQRMQEQVTARQAGPPPGCARDASTAGTTCGPAAGSARARVYLFGNSIAGMYREALVDASERLDARLTLYTHPGGFCARTDAQGCPPMFAEAYDELLDGGASGVVVMAGTWDVGAFSGGASREKAAELADSLGGVLTALHEAGHHVVIVLPTPRFFEGDERGTFAPAPPAGGDHEPHATVWRPKHCPRRNREERPDRLRCDAPRS